MVSDLSMAASRSVALALAASLAAGCGGNPHAQRAARPALPRTVAVRLAAVSEQVARELDTGNACEARTTAQQLQRQTIQAINGARVPAALQEPLQSTVNDLAARIRCVPAPPQIAPLTPRSNGQGKHKGHEKHKGHGGDQGD
jgi:hypothetical protein